MIERTIVQPVCDIPVGFAGEYGVLREPNGLYYMNARFYDPAMGRFLSEDPAELGGGDITLYSYASNNPFVFVDPSGLCRTSSGPAGTYGNWGGPGWSGGKTGKLGPVDDLDRIFMMHDVDYLNSGLDFKNNPANYVSPKLNSADFSLIKRTDSILKLNPSTWSNPPSDPDFARRYGNAANFIFNVKYNYQLIEDLFR